MALSTYSELKTSIAGWLNREDADTIAKIPDFIALAEANFNRSVRHWRMEKRSTAIANTQYTALPEDFIEPLRFSITSGTTTRLEMLSQAQMLDRRESSDNVANNSRFYAITDGSIELFPTPSSDQTLEMVYYSRPTALSDVNNSNWLLTYYPDAYLYGSLVHSAPYLADDSRLQVWAALLQSAIDAINFDSDKAKHGGAGHRMKIRSF